MEENSPDKNELSTKLFADMEPPPEVVRAPDILNVQPLDQPADSAPKQEEKKSAFAIGDDGSDESYWLKLKIIIIL